MPGQPHLTGPRTLQLVRDRRGAKNEHPNTHKIRGSAMRTAVRKLNRDTPADWSGRDHGRRLANLQKSRAIAVESVNTLRAAPHVRLSRPSDVLRVLRTLLKRRQAFEEQSDGKHNDISWK